MKHDKRSFKGFKLGLYTDGVRVAIALRVRDYKKKNFIQVGYCIIQNENQRYDDEYYDSIFLEYCWADLTVFKKRFPDYVDEIVIEKQ